jgi:hypothetical protein
LKDLVGMMPVVDFFVRHSGGVSPNLSTHWQPVFCDTWLPWACPAASKKVDNLCLS